MKWVQFPNYLKAVLLDSKRMNLYKIEFLHHKQAKFLKCSRLESLDFWTRPIFNHKSERTFFVFSNKSTNIEPRTVPHSLKITALKLLPYGYYLLN